VGDAPGRGWSRLAPDAEIRVAGPADVDDVARLIAAFRDFYGETSPADSTIRETAGELLDDRGTEFLLAGTPAAGIAQLRFRLSLWTGTDDAWLEDLFVLDGARGSGLGRALVRACIERARARGCDRIQLDANEGNPGALALYESLGFRCAKRERWDGGRDLYWTRWL
jgi:GNAT superfamily N-acetyltransferase